MEIHEDLISTRDAYERVAALTDEDHANLMLAWAIRSDDRTLAVAIVQRAETQGWSKLAANTLTTYVEHHVGCQNGRIEVVDYPQLGKSTTHCVDCSAHRLHDGAGLPLTTTVESGATPTAAVIVRSAQPSTTKGSR